MFVANKYQLAFYEYVQAYYKLPIGMRRHVVLSAGPGCGKTATAAHIIEHVPADKRILGLAFNNSAKEELKERMEAEVERVRRLRGVAPEVDVRTMHSYGKALLSGYLKSIGVKMQDLKENDDKYSKLIRKHVDAYNNSHELYIPSSLFPALKKLCNFSRNMLLTKDNLNEDFVYKTADNELLDEEETLTGALHWVLRNTLIDGFNLGKQGVVDFGDLIWLPCMYKGIDARAYNCAFDIAIGDEAQDFTESMLTLFTKTVRKGGALVAIGDRNQAIQAWMGARPDSLDEIKRRLNAIELQLPISYRCPKTVVSLARSICPDTVLESPETMAEGRILHISNSDVISKVRPGSMILCTRNAPLVRMCFDLIRADIPAKILGYDIGKDLASFVDHIKKYALKEYHECLWEDFETYIQAYYEHYSSILLKDAEKNEKKLQSLVDKIETIRVFLENTRVRDYDSFSAYIVGFFDRKGYAVVTLSTGHRSKGLEAKIVFVLDADVSFKLRTELERQQYANLRYVMYTRTKYASDDHESGTLYFCYQNYVPETSTSTSLVVR